MKQADKIALQEWERLKADIVRATPVDRKMTHAERDKHRIQLESNPIEWIKFLRAIRQERVCRFSAACDPADRRA